MTGDPAPDLNDPPPDGAEPSLETMHQSAVAHDLANQTEAALEIYLAIIRRASLDEQPPARPLANALERVGTIMGASGQLQTATRCFDQLISRFADDGDVAEFVASAFYNRGVAHREEARLDAALRDFDQVSQRFTNSSDADVRRLVSMALHSKGMICLDKAQSSNDAEQYFLALDTFREIISQFGTDSDAAIQLRVGSSLKQVARALKGNGDPDKARSLFNEIIRRFGGSSDPQLTSLVLEASRHILWALYDERQPSMLELRLRESTAPHAKTFLEILQIPIADVERRHEQALAILREFYADGSPFCLYLKNFDKEASFNLIETGDADRLVDIVVWGDPPGEPLFATTLATRLPMIGVVNIENLRPRISARALPALRVTESTWPSVVHALIHLASFIIVDIDAITPGVELELDMVVSQNKHDSCAVILTPRKSASSPHSLMHVALAAFHPSHTPPAELLDVDKSATQLSAFKNVFWLNEIHAGTLEHLPGLQELIDDVQGRRRGQTSTDDSTPASEESGC